MSRASAAVVAPLASTTPPYRDTISNAPLEPEQHDDDDQQNNDRANYGDDGLFHKRRSHIITGFVALPGQGFWINGLLGENGTDGTDETDAQALKREYWRVSVTCR